MELEDRRAEPGLIERLLQEPWHFSFFQIVQLLERSRSGAAGVGGSQGVGQEILRFRPSLSLGFPSSDVAAVEVEEDPSGTERFRVEVNFLGLYGSVSPLPMFFTEDLLRETDDESLVRGFLDIFHHRLISLFYRCWSKYRHYVQYRDGGTDDFSKAIFCLAGLGSARPPDTATLRSVKLLRYAGLMTQAPASAASLEAALGDLLEEPGVNVLPFAPRWVKIRQAQRNRLGVRNCSLGRDLHAGEEVLDRAGKFRVRIGPVNLDGFVAYLPGTERADAVDEMVRLLVRDPLQYEVEVVLQREEVPELRIEPDAIGARLGQTTWFGQPPSDTGVVFQEPYGA